MATCASCFPPAALRSSWFERVERSAYFCCLLLHQRFSKVVPGVGVASIRALYQARIVQKGRTCSPGGCGSQTLLAGSTRPAVVPVVQLDEALRAPLGTRIRSDISSFVDRERGTCRVRLAGPRGPNSNGIQIKLGVTEVAGDAAELEALAEG